MKLLKTIALLLCLNAPIRAVFPDIPENERTELLLNTSLLTSGILFYNGLENTGNMLAYHQNLIDLKSRPQNAALSNQIAKHRRKRDDACVSALVNITASIMLLIPGFFLATYDYTHQQ